MVVKLSLKFEYEEKVIGSINSYHKLLCESIYKKCQESINDKVSLPYSFDIMIDHNLLTSVHDLKPILKILGLPFTIITLGLFSLVINAIVILLADYFVDGMTIDGFWWALIFSIALSVISSLLNGIFISDKES